MAKKLKASYTHLIGRILVALTTFVLVSSQGLECDFTDSECGWSWSDGFILLSGDNSTHLASEHSTAPGADSRNDTKGQFLYYSPTVPGLNVKLELVSPLFAPMTKQKCSLELSLHMYNMDEANFKIFIQSSENNNTWEIKSFLGNSLHRWERFQAVIALVSQPFNVLLEVLYATVVPSHLAIDDLKAVDCYNTKPTTDCEPGQFQCSDLICILAHKVCNTVADCVDGEDEDQDCDQIPASAMCTFEKDSCGWNNTRDGDGMWVRYSGDSPNPRTGPSFDHTYQNETGVYMMAKFPSGRNFGIQADLTSPVFEAPPYYHRNVHSAFYNTCQVRFFFHKYGDKIGDLRLFIYELDPAEPKPQKTELWRSYGNRGDFWHEVVKSLPAISNKYYIQFSGGRGVGHSDIAIDDITLSPKCFGIGVPPNETSADPNKVERIITTEPPEKEPELKRISFTTCGVKGRFGPNETLCELAYHNTTTKIDMMTTPGMKGFQMWKVPNDGLYTIFVRGAGGGNGVNNRRNSLGTFLRATFQWSKDDTIFIVVGQQGVDACSRDTTRFLRSLCEDQESLRSRFKLKRDVSIIRKMNQKRDEGGGGGGGGASYVFKQDPLSQNRIALIVAGGGGGLSAKYDSEMYINPQGLGINNSMLPINGYSGMAAGGGGGWEDATMHSTAGQSLKEGAQGGKVCDRASVWETHGGFGGGGGGCAAGGGGGGYRGGDSSPVEGKYFNGYGGTSFISDHALRPLVEPGQNPGDGSVTIMAAQPGCGCDYMCVLLDPDGKEFYCICPEILTLSVNGVSCIAANGQSEVSPTVLVIIILSIIIVLVVCAIFIHFALSKYRKSHNYRDLSHEPLNNPEVQLNRLRNAGGMVTEYNPNYEFGGSTCSAQDLNEIQREQLTLVKALGQGAFGEVYEGFLTNPSDNVEKQVAVKTLPEFSSSQTEMDFLMEALIMSKFNHPNIVSFIGVCFEKMPRFIVLELLKGGDLKSYLREHRPKPQKPSTLTVSDLLRMALDVAKGCQYLEENHFIHRDIAARNCLLTTKEPDWVVKIADFGMARDIYRADYYRKGGKAMLPVKWMPPEAFLDGIFTTKTDVWSFGVLLWEVISIGFMPYPGRANQEVMQLVTSGGRLEPPTNCPSPVYHIMMQCWHPLPSERPNFTTLIERLGYCLQDPDVINAELPVFNRPPSMERDATVVRPADEDSEECLQVHRPEANSLLSPGSEDYLIPMPHSMYSLTNTTTDRTDLQSSPSVGSSDQLLEMSDRGRSGGENSPSMIILSSPTWETNFMTPDTPPAQVISNVSTPDDPDIARSSKNLKKKSGGYTEVPSEDTNSKTKSPETTPNGPKMPDIRKSSVHSVDDLPIAPSVSTKNDNLPTGYSQSNLSLDASALTKQMNSGEALPRGYINVDVNCNAGADSNGSAIRIGSSDQNLANRNSVLGPLDGYSGVNPVA